MKLDPMKEALKKRAAKIEGSPEEEKGESKAEEKKEKEKEALGLAPDTKKGKGGGEGLPLKGPIEDGDADLSNILSKMGDMGNEKGSLSFKAKEGMKNKLAKGKGY